MAGSSVMAFPFRIGFYLSHVEIVPQVYGTRSINKTKNPQKGVLCVVRPHNYNMNIKKITNWKLLTLFIVLFMFGFTVKVNGEVRYTGDYFPYTEVTAGQWGLPDIDNNTNCHYMTNLCIREIFIDGVYQHPPTVYHDATTETAGAGYPDGVHHYNIWSDSTTTATMIGWTEFTLESGTVTEIPPNTTTRIISTDPTNYGVENPAFQPFNATSTATVVVNVDIYFNDVTDGNFIDQVCVELDNAETAESIIPICEPIIASGESTLTFTFEDLPHGRFLATAYFDNTVDFLHFYSHTWEFINQYSIITNQTCLFGNEINGLCQPEGFTGYASTTPYATTSPRGMTIDDCSTMTDLPTKALCAVSNTLKKTVNWLVIPDEFVYNEFVGNIKDDMLTHFPIGYITDFYEIISTSTVGNLTVIDATLPSALGMGNANVHLDLTNVLDPILNATTSQFTNESASSTETLYTITNRYWSYLIYILAGLYMIGRIIPLTQKIR